MSKTSEQKPVQEGMRIAKMIARAGVCSRRDAERLIEAGKVMVNGKLLKTPALNVSAKDIILVNDQPLPVSEPVRLWRYHKPRGRMTSHKDPQGRPTVFESLPDHLPRVISVGRLDYNTEGLMLLTTDGGLARHLELPATGWRRRYKVRAFGKITQGQLDALKKGITIDGVHYGEILAELERAGSNPWINITISEGKNSEVRRVLEHLGMKVSRLIRLSYGPFQLSELTSGSVEEVKRRVLADQLGKKLADEFELGPKPQVRKTDDSKMAATGSKPKRLRAAKKRNKPPMGDKRKGNSRQANERPGNERPENTKKRTSKKKQPRK